MKSYAIADAGLGIDDAFFKRVSELSEAGIDYVQLRARDAGGRQLWEWASRMRTLIRMPARLLISTRLDVALATGADGVHLPSSGLPAAAIRASAPGLLIGRSCHSVADVHAAVAEHCDYVLLGPVFDVRSKPGLSRISASDLSSASALATEVFALGGISRDNLATLAGSGIAGVAAITLFMVDGPAAMIVEEVRAN